MDLGLVSQRQWKWLESVTNLSSSYPSQRLCKNMLHLHVLIQKKTSSQACMAVYRLTQHNLHSYDSSCFQLVWRQVSPLLRLAWWSFSENLWGHWSACTNMHAKGVHCPSRQALTKYTESNVNQAVYTHPHSSENIVRQNGRKRQTKETCGRFYAMISEVVCFC